MGIANSRELGNSDHLFDVPYEGADSYFLVAFVEFADGKEDGFYFFVVDDGEYGVVHFGPGVGAAVGVAVDMAAALHVFPEGEASYVEGVEQVFYTFGVGLVEDD